MDVPRPQIVHTLMPARDKLLAWHLPHTLRPIVARRTSGGGFGQCPSDIHVFYCRYSSTPHSSETCRRCGGKKNTLDVVSVSTTAAQATRKDPSGQDHPLVDGVHPHISIEHTCFHTYADGQGPTLRTRAPHHKPRETKGVKCNSSCYAYVLFDFVFVLIVLANKI